LSCINDPITDHEILSAEEIFLPKGAFFDDQRRTIIKCMETANIAAAPGSGKTTVLLAKLFILAQRMPFKDNKGICVLTHTNVAIDEIKARLGSRGDVLFSYPNFFGTFQSFIDKYLAIPYFSMTKKSRSIIIDQHYYEEKIATQFNFGVRKYKDAQRNAKYFLLSRRENYKTIRLKLVDGRVILTDGINGKEININRPSRSFKIHGDFSTEEKQNIYNWIVELKRTLLNDGIFCYDDAYYLAEQFISRYGSQLNEVFSKRFKFVFIDESQDTYKHQYKILESLFNKEVIKQYYGDPNQAIFDSKNSNQASIWYPNAELNLSIPQSQRFGIKIAEKLSTICVDQNNQIEGSPIIQSLKPHIILFNKVEISKVLEKFVELIKSYDLHLTNEDERKNINKAIGWRGNGTEDILNKLCLASYFPSFSKKAKENKGVHYNNLISYIKKLPEDVTTRNGVKVYSEALMNGIIRFLYLVNVKNNNNKSKGWYFNKSSLLQYLKENYDKGLFQLEKNMSEWILKIHHEKMQYNLEVYESIKQYLMNDFIKFWPKLDLSKAQHFLEDTTPEISEKESQIQNYYISTYHPEIKIKVDTVHAVKGETHRATLFLETFKEKHDLKMILPFLKGQFDKKLAIKKQINAALKVAYVGMSRPTHFLCLALDSEGLEQSDLAELESSGWEIIYVNQAAIPS
jgi:DNA helicase II / ATP-dependent DNA helicase PcrA